MAFFARLAAPLRFIARVIPARGRRSARVAEVFLRRFSARVLPVSEPVTRFSRAFAGRTLKLVAVPAPGSAPAVAPAVEAVGLVSLAVLFSRRARRIYSNLNL